LSWRKKLLFMPIPALIIGGAVEVGFRLSQHMQRDDGSRVGNFLPDPDLRWRINPERIATNELGLRDTPYRADARVKVLLLGDSVSCAERTPIEQTFPYLLERAFEASSGQTVEVINSGVSGYSTFQQLRYLQLRGLALEPDLVVLQFCLNDVVERYHTVAEYGGNAFFLGIDTRATATGIYGFLMRNSVAFEVIARSRQRSAARREEYDVRKLVSDQLSPELDQAWALALEEVDGVRRACAARGVPLVLLVTPYTFQLESPTERRQPQDRLLAWARAHEVPGIDVLPAFAARPKPWWGFRDANHFNPAGHALVAELAHEALRDHPALAPE
jgi:lysophospholipase L1-like esterase